MTTLTNASKKICVGAAALAFLALGATDCFAAGCPEPCVAQVKKVAIHEPACAAELPYQLGTAVWFEKNGDTSVLTIMGPKAEVTPEYVGVKRKTIREGRLVFVQEYYDVDADFTSVKLVMKDNLEFYPGFVKEKQFEGDFDMVTNMAMEYTKKGYQFIEFDGYGHITDAKGIAAVGKKF